MFTLFKEMLMLKNVIKLKDLLKAMITLSVLLLVKYSVLVLVLITFITLFFASGGKAKVKILQSIGRGLRLHKNKNKLVIIDIADQLRYSTQHSEKRIELYQKENIQTKIVDFYENS